MIDLHSHILPGLDDGAQDMAMSLAMARIAVEDGTTHIACTPHIMPGVYENTARIILERVTLLQSELASLSIPLKLVAGADIHISPDIVDGLNNGRLPTLGGSRYFLFEPPHHVLPPRLPQFCKQILQAGYVPVLTHPERLTWIEQHYSVMCELDELGVPIQLTAGSITGRFGQRAKYWSDRMLVEGRVDLIASDGHNTTGRPPKMQSAFTMIAERLGEDAAKSMTLRIPALILTNAELPEKSRSPDAAAEPGKRKGLRGWLRS